MHSSGASRQSFHQRALSGFSRRGRTDIGLRMAPMIDVIFLLLTFFVLTAHLRRTEGFVPLPLVPAQSSESFSVIEPLRLELTALPDGCCVRLGTEEEMVLSREGAPEDFSALAERIERVCLRQQRRRDDPVELVCGDDVSWDFVVKVYDVLRVTGLKQITFVISDADEENAE